MKDKTPAGVIVNKVVPVIENVTACKSVAVIVPTSVAPSSTTKVEEDVNTGTVVSATFTVLVAVPVLPAASVALYEIV